MKWWIMVALLAWNTPCFAYDLKNLSRQDVLTLGAGLDELPRKVGEANGLWNRLQQQIAEQDLAAAKAGEAAMRKKIEEEREAPKAPAPLPAPPPEGLPK